jgi:hypothetical protein
MTTKAPPPLNAQQQAERASLEIRLENSRRAMLVAKQIDYDHTIKMFPNITQVSDPYDYQKLLSDQASSTVINEEREKSLLEMNLVSVGMNKSDINEIFNNRNLSALEMGAINVMFRSFVSWVKTQAKPPIPPKVFMGLMKKYLQENTIIPPEIPDMMEGMNGEIKPQDPANPDFLNEPNPQPPIPPQIQNPRPDEETDDEEGAFRTPPNTARKEKKKATTPKPKSYPFLSIPLIHKQLKREDAIDAIKKEFSANAGMAEFFNREMSQYDGNKKKLKIDYNNDKETLNKILVYIQDDEDFKTEFGKAQNVGFGLKPTPKKKHQIHGRGRAVKINDEANKEFRHNRASLNLHKLNDGILHVSYISTGKPIYQPQMVSPDTKEAILDLINDKFDKRFYSKLHKQEKKGVIHTVLGLGLPDKHEIVKGHLDKLYHDFEVARGEVEAGNNNEEIKKELKELTKELVILRKIPFNVGRDVMAELNGI